MIIHSIISEYDIFFAGVNYMQKDAGSHYIPCITDPKEFLKRQPVLDAGAKLCYNGTQEGVEHNGH
jgi:hypothetical protein